MQEEDFLSFVTESDLAFVFTMFEYAMMYWTIREEQEVNDQMIVSQVPEFTETQTVGVTIAAATVSGQISMMTNPSAFASMGSATANELKRKKAGRVAGKEGFQSANNVRRFNRYGHGIEAQLDDNAKREAVKSWIDQAWKWVNNDADEGEDELDDIGGEEESENVDNSKRKAIP